MGPVSGYLSDWFGARPFATGGMIAAAASWSRGARYVAAEHETAEPGLTAADAAAAAQRTAADG